MTGEDDESSGSHIRMFWRKGKSKSSAAAARLRSFPTEEMDALLEEGQHGTQPSTGMRITMKDVGYTVRSLKDRRTEVALLKNITGYFEPGQMAALIGPSGSGKTTLVDVLSGRKTQGQIDGVIRYAEERPTQALLRKYVGYVEQFDVLIESLTVQEMLMYTAELKRPMSESHDDKKACVNRLLEKLLLWKGRDKRIGDQGGVKKRVNIGIALISSPKVLFLDEPTTGLDSYTANETMTVVKRMALDGTTICSTIHSPTPYTFSLFDRVMFLLGGEIVFFGETKMAIHFLDSFAQGIVNTYDNDADWLTMIIVKADRERRGPEIAAAFAESNIKKEVDRFVNDCTEGSFEDNGGTKLALDRPDRDTSTSFWFTFMTLIKYRTFKHITDPTFWLSRMADKLTFLFLLVVTYHGVGDNFSFPDFQNVVSVLFILVCFPLFGAGVYAPSIVLERSLMYREMNDGMYTTGTYLLMKVVDEMIAGVISTLIIAGTAWKVLALQGNMLTFFLVYFGNLVNGIATAYICAAVGGTVHMCNALLATYTTVLLFFAGMLIIPSDMPVYWKWIHDVDYTKYGFGVLMYNAFTSSEEVIQQAIFYRLPPLPPLPALEYYELADVDTKWWTAVIYLFVAGHLFAAYVCTKFISHQKR